MDQRFLEGLLSAVQNKTLTVADALKSLSTFPGEPVSDACIDHQRTIRTGIPEVIFGEAKSADQIITIAQSMLAQSGPVIATRIDPEKAAAIVEAIPDFDYHKQARMLSCRWSEINEETVRGTILLICAGTSDIPIAEEARITAQCLGHPVQTLYDVGVAGLHRLLDRQKMLSEASVIIVAAGMEGALPSVIGGLVSCPVIAVPTSVGYGTGTGGYAALLGMLNSCAPGVAVVNIDNGFGAACMALAINRA